MNRTHKLQPRFLSGGDEKIQQLGSCQEKKIGYKGYHYATDRATAVEVKLDVVGSTHRV